MKAKRTEPVRDTATIEIDADANVASVNTGVLNWDDISFPVRTGRAVLIGSILAMQSRELMAMSAEELVKRRLALLG